MRVLSNTWLWTSAFLAGGVLSALPDLVLDWGTYQASSISNLSDVQIYRDVRFGLPPTGSLRFSAAKSPDKSFVQKGDSAASCIQVPTKLLKDSKCNAKPDLTVGFVQKEETQGEDCLFLDIYVPSNLTSYKDPLPVVVWFYGGGYIFGSKSGAGLDGILYSGVGPIRNAARQHGNGMIFVVGNYRMGAYGWLAGSYMEQNATPNAGLTDQRLVLEFVQKYISQLKGDPSNVSAWGESAGGGSIVHHLVSSDSTGAIRDPLFKRALVQSPAYEWMWDRNGSLQKAYMTFAEKVNCPGGDIACLRKADPELVKNANNEMACDDHRSGLFPFGPAVDGILIKELPVYAIGTSGNYWKNLDSIITSNVIYEAAGFTKNLTVDSQTTFAALVNLSFPTNIVKLIQNIPYFKRVWPWPEPCGGWNPFTAWHKCYTSISQDSMFISNTHALCTAYAGKCYMINYGWPKDIVAYHATDLLPTFYYDEISIEAIVEALKFTSWNWLNKELTKWMTPRLKYTAQYYQKYFSSHAITGSPNQYRYDGAPEWPLATDTPSTGLRSGVLSVNVPGDSSDTSEFFNIDSLPDGDVQYTFWLGILSQIVKPTTSNAEEYKQHGDEL